jgi:hypothetical protein
VPDAWLALFDVGAGPGVVEAPNAETVAWQPAAADGSAEPSEDARPPAMQDEMREADQVLCKLFFRNGLTGKYIYAGLGHLPPHGASGALEFKLVPRFDRGLYRAAGFDDRWVATVTDQVRGDLWPQRRPRDLDEVMAVVKAFERVSQGTLELARWGPQGLTVHVLDDRCFATFAGWSGGKPVYKYLTDPVYAGAPADEFALPERWHQPPIAARTLKSRKVVGELVRLFVEGDGELPWADDWKADPFAEEEMKEPESADAEEVQDDEAATDGQVDDEQEA